MAPDAWLIHARVVAQCGASGHLSRLEAVLKALSNRRRLLMLSAIRRHGDIHVSALAEHVRLPLKTVSRNLRLLERAGLVESEQRGGFVFYCLNSRSPSLTGVVLDDLETH